MNGGGTDRKVKQESGRKSEYPEIWILILGIIRTKLEEPSQNLAITQFIRCHGAWASAWFCHCRSEKSSVHYQVLSFLFPLVDCDRMSAHSSESQSVSSSTYHEREVSSARHILAGRYRYVYLVQVYNTILGRNDCRFLGVMKEKNLVVPIT